MHIAIISGSGMEDRLTASGIFESARPVEVDTPFGPPSSPIVTGRISGTGVPLAVLKRHGNGHNIPPHRVPWRANIFALKQLGVTHLIATAAVGSLREHIQPGQLVLCDQLLDRTTGAGTRGAERTFFDHAAVHVELADPCCGVMRAWLDRAAGAVDASVHNGGVYVTIDGPQFSTRAESRMHRAMGADVVGMTALPEARLAREAEIAYALVALPTDYDSWRQPPPDQPPADQAAAESILSQVVGNLQRSAAAAAGLLDAALRDTTALAQPSHAHEALKFAVWTRKELIPPAEVDRLWPIWGRHFRPE